MTPQEMLGLACAFTYARDYNPPSKAWQTTDIALRLVRAEMGWPAVARYLPTNFKADVFNARGWLRNAARIIEGADHLRGVA